MIFEVITCGIMGGLALKAHLSTQGATNDSGKIQKIFTLSGLNVKDGKETLTAQQLKKVNYDWGTEYRFRIPLGRSFEDYLAKHKVIEDGLNSKRIRYNLRDLRELKFDRNFIKSVIALQKGKLSKRRDVELSYDGVLIIRVYNEPLTKEVPWEEGSEWSVPVGITRSKNVMRYHDFEKIPHMVLGGATRYGKSNFINSTICSLLTTQPEYVKLFLVDLKGGVELCDYESLGQTLSIAYEPEEALETLKAAYEKMREIQVKLKKLGKKNVQEAGIKERYFVIIDEVGELNPDEAVDKKDIRKDGEIIHKSEKTIKEECQKYMSQIARLGAGLGFRQILATQYPTGDVIPRQCKQNSDAKIAFRVQSATASRVVLDGDGAETLPQIKGRAIYQTADQREILQTPLIESKDIKTTVTPHINIRAKEEKDIEAKQQELEPARGKHSFIIEDF